MVERFKKYPLYLAGILLLANVVLFERVTSQQNWNLFDIKENFLVGKRLTEMSLMGSDHFLLSRSGIAHGELHMDRWFGFQSLQTTTIHELREATVEGGFAKNGELTVSWKTEEKTSEGFRLSPNGSSYFRATVNGEWETAIPIPVTFPRSYSNGILNYLSASSRKDDLPEFAFNIKLKFKGNQVSIYEDDTFLKAFPIRSARGNFIVQGNDFPVVLDRLSVTNEKGKVIEENFEPALNKLAFFLYSCFAIVLYLFLSKLFEKKPLWFIHARNTSYFSLVLFLSIWLFDRYHFSNFQIDLWGKLNISQTREDLMIGDIERWRFNFFQGFLKTPADHRLISEYYPEFQIWRGPIFCSSYTPCRKIPETPQDLGGPLNRDSKKMLLVGSSQSIGAGATWMEESFFVLLHQKYKELYPNIRSLNISISGGTPDSMLKEFHPWFEKYNPDIVIINLGFNGGHLSGYRDVLKTFLRITRDKEVIVINEAATNHLSKMQEVSRFNREMGEIHHVLVVPLFEKMLAVTNSHRANIWWDFVHFNDLGHDLAAKIIFEHIKLAYQTKQTTPVKPIARLGN